MSGPIHWKLKADALLVPGRGVARVPHLEAFLPEVARIDRRGSAPANTDAVAGWGFKPTAAKARAIAAARGLPYIALEDGFLRSIGLGEAGAPPIGLVADDLGIYYDARGPSRIETLIESGEGLTRETVARGAAAMARIVELGLSKTNASPPLDPATLPATGKRRVLIVDQTLGDASIEGALATSASFSEMIAAARGDEPDAELIVRRHPAVAAGLKRGCIPADALAGTTLLDADARAADILSRVDAVYCVSSLLGFEALMRGLPVRCFGLPFYAGWGATKDGIICEQRVIQRSIEEIFTAAYLLYSRYVDPIAGTPTTLEDTIERLAEWRAVADANAGHFAAVGFRPWKRGSVRNLLASPRGGIAFHRSVTRAAVDARAKNGRILFWAGKESRATTAELDAAGAPVARMEDGFLRSRGLGSDFHLPASVVVDDEGIYFDRERPSALETILSSADFPPALTARAAEIRARLVAEGLSKYNVGQARPLAAPDGRDLLLVVGQVEDDRSIERGTAEIATNAALLAAARADHPQAWIVFKPHPDVETGNRKGVVSEADLARLADDVARDADIASCLAAADALATMTSLAGFEALLRGKRVITYGGPFYAGWGLTEDRMTFPRRTRRLSLDELVAGTLILYPRYVHPPSGLPCRAEEVVDWLSGANAGGSRRWRWLRALVQSVARGAPARY